MKILHLLGVVFAIPCALGVPPAILSSGWRRIHFNVNGMAISMSVFEIKFDQELYVNGPTGLTKLADVTDAIGEWPRIAYHMQGSLGITCNGMSANKYSWLQDAPNYIMVVPPTDDAVASFFGYFAGFFLTHTKRYDTLTFVILDGLSGINTADVTQCLSAGLTVELFPSPCLPTSQQVSAINSQFQGPNGGAGPYKASDLVCGVSNAGGEMIPNQNYTFMTTPTPLECTLAGVQQLQADLIQMRQEFKQISGQNALNGIQFAELAMTSRLSFQGCQDILNQVIQFETITRRLPDSQDCPDRSNITSLKYLRDPCCNHREGRCCAPRPVNQTFKAPANVSFNALQGICPSAATDPVIRGLLVIFALNLQRELSAPPPPNVNVLYQNLFWNVWGECQGSLYGQCRNNKGCYSRNCDTNIGYCRPSDTGDALPMIRCLVEKYNGGSGTLTAAFQVFAKINSAETDPEVIAQGIFDNLFALYGAYDCVGQQSYPHRTRLEYLRDPNTGIWGPVFIPANQTGCLANKRCNWNPWQPMTASECANNGIGSSFCASCGGGQCQDLSRFPVCRISWQLSGSTSAMDCASVGGVLGRTSMYSPFPECVLIPVNETTNVNSCFDPICPGPNSSNQWIKDLFAATSEYNYACDPPLCYNATLTMSECNALGNGVWWADQYRNGMGLCVRFAYQFTVANGIAMCSTLSSQTGHIFTYFPGTTFQKGQLYNKATCENAKICSLRDRPPFPVATNADCTSQSACDFSCPACVQTSTQSLVCATDFNQTACSDRKQGNPQFDSATMKCMVEVKDAAACALLPGGAIITCRNYNETQCALKRQSFLRCQYQTWAPCQTQADCMMQGECDDYDLATRGVCVYPFPRDPMGKPIIRCGVPMLNGYPCQNCPGLPSTENKYTWGRIGCILGNQTLVRNRTLCEMSVAPYNSSANGIWMSRAQTQSECIGRAKGCKRFGSWLTRIEQKECTDCKGKFGDLYSWRKGRMLPGKLVNLKWMPRQLQSENAWVNTLSVAILQLSLEDVVSRFLGTGYGNSIVQNYAFRFSLYERMITRCTNSNEPIGAVGGLVGACECFGGGKPCEGFCPFECEFPCAYDAITYMAFAIGINTRRRLMGGPGAAYEIVKDGTGAVVGAYVGDALQLSGTGISGIHRICVPDNVQYTSNISAAYTVYDFAPTLPGSNAPGIPMGLAVVREGTSTCGNVTIGSFGVYPIKRLANFVRTTAPPTGSPAKSGGTATTTMIPTTTVTPSVTNGQGRSVAKWGISLAFVFGLYRVFDA